MKTSMRRWMLASIIILCVLIWVSCFVGLNNSFHARYDRPTVYYDSGDDIPLGDNLLMRGTTADGYVLNFGTVSMVTPEELAEVYSIPNEIIEEINSQSEYLLTVPVTVKNSYNSEDPMIYEVLELYGVDWCAYLDSKWTAAINKDWETHKCCEIGSQQTYMLVFQPKDLLTGDRFTKFQQEKIWVHITYYPVIIEAVLQ